ncbi:MAG: hypothetical protein IJU78_05205 [Clostridia bacterium]|nr:hypothetical protein [Clostridia bacterium]
MPAPDELLKNGAPDGDRLQQIMALAAAMSGRSGAAGGGAQSTVNPSAAQTDGGAQNAAASPFGSSKLAEALPILMQAFSGSGDFVDADRVNLVKAMRPYISAERAGSMDRAIRMANMAKAAQTALGILGR